MSQASPCSAGHTVWYLKDEVVETWLQAQIDAGEWIKGKINCPHCTLRIGSFDFVSGKLCDCGQHVLPPIHIVKSRVDHENPEILRRALAQYSGEETSKAGADGKETVDGDTAEDGPVSADNKAEVEREVPSLAKTGVAVGDDIG